MNEDDLTYIGMGAAALGLIAMIAYNWSSISDLATKLTPKTPPRRVVQPSPATKPSPFPPGYNPNVEYQRVQRELERQRNQ